MNKESKSFLFKLLNTPSPTGFEQGIQKLVSARMKKYADTVETDVHGNLIVGINTKAKRSVMLAGHCDQIGFMVKHITDKGFLYVEKLGGIDTGVVQGARVRILAQAGPVEGIFGRKPIHLQKPEERSKGINDLDKLWIDIGAKDKKQAEKLIQPGDPVVYTPEITELQNGLIAGPGLDNRVGLFVAMETLRRLSRARLSVALYSVSTVQEEVGLRGATTATYRLKPDVGIAIDVTHGSDNPGQSDSKATPCELGKGPTVVRGPNINPVVEKMLFAAAKKSKLPVQPAPSASLLGNDARSMQVSGIGVATGSIGIPNRYMHTQVEVCALQDLETASKLLASFVKDVGQRTNFTPR